MKSIAMILVTAVCAWNVHSQGTLNCSNGATGVNAPVKLADGQLVQGPDWKAELLLVDTAGNLNRVAGPFTFETGAVAGYVFSGTVEIPGTEAGDSVTCRLRVFNSAHSLHGLSRPVSVVLGGGKVPPANLVGLQSIVVAPTKLSVTVSESKVVLSWPKESVDYSLQSAPRLTDATWENVLAERITTATSVVVTLPAGLSTQFFRLALE